jgi:cytochrome c5
MNKDPNVQQLFKGLTRAAIALLAIILLGIGAAFFVAFYGGASSENSSPEAVSASAPLATEIVDGKDLATGFVVDEGFEIVKVTCTACHSSDIVLQNKFTREGWKAKIVWMQETQGLWDLGDNEAIILDYLAKHHAPAPPTGRRVPLKDIKWYDLND